MHSTRYGRQRRSFFLAEQALERQGRLWVACVQLWLAATPRQTLYLKHWPEGSNKRMQFVANGHTVSNAPDFF